MKNIFTIILTLFYLAGFSQKSYTVGYTFARGVAFDSNTYTNLAKTTLFINADTLSFFKYGIPNPKMKKTIKLSDEQSHHGTLHFLKSDSLLEVSSIFDKKYLIPYQRKYGWKILADTMNILGYTCTKAISDSGTVAWFTYAIPLNAGPWYYYGLPGLILEILDVTNYKAKNVLTVDFIKNESPTIVFPKKYQIVTPEVYMKKINRR